MWNDIKLLTHMRHEDVKSQAKSHNKDGEDEDDFQQCVEDLEEHDNVDANVIKPFQM